MRKWYFRDLNVYTVDFHEHRSEHQLGMAKEFKDIKGVYIAHTKWCLFKLLDDYRSLKPSTIENIKESKALVCFLKKEIFVT